MTKGTQGGSPRTCLGAGFCAPCELCAASCGSGVGVKPEEGAPTDTGKCPSEAWFKIEVTEILLTITVGHRFSTLRTKSLLWTFHLVRSDGLFPFVFLYLAVGLTTTPSQGRSPAQQKRLPPLLGPTQMTYELQVQGGFTWGWRGWPGC